MNKAISTPIAIIIVLIVFTISIGLILLGYMCWPEDEVILKETEEEAIEDSEPQIPIGCTDSDNGKNYYTRGEVYGRWNISSPYKYYPDMCEGDILTESYCNDDSPTLNYYKCPNGCESGVCKSEIRPSITVISLYSGQVIDSPIHVEWITQGEIDSVGIGFCPEGKNFEGKYDQNCTMDRSFPNTGNADFKLGGGVQLQRGKWKVYVTNTHNRSVYGMGWDYFVIGSY